MRIGRIILLGIGCSLYSDQGLGITLIQTLTQRYRFPEQVQVVDGGLIGIGLTGIIAQAEHVIAVDAMRFGGRPGDICRLTGTRILERLKMKNHVQHVDFLEALSHCQILDQPPEAVLFGIEPEDDQTLSCTLTPILQERTDEMIARILCELDRLGITYEKNED